MSLYILRSLIMIRNKPIPSFYSFQVTTEEREVSPKQNYLALRYLVGTLETHYTLNL